MTNWMKTQREGKYSLDKIESYLTLFENMLAPKSNPLLAVDSMNSEEFHAHSENCEKMQIYLC